MRADLRVSLSNHMVIPETREKLIAVATTMEGNMRLTKGARASNSRTNYEPTRGSRGSSRSRGSYSASSTRGRGGHRAPDVRKSDTPDEPERKPGTCWSCGEPGHISPNCPKKRKGNNPNKAPVNQVKAGKA
nr:hypothetical protein CFP56_16487 [Quercus suber]